MKIILSFFVILLSLQIQLSAATQSYTISSASTTAFPAQTVTLNNSVSSSTTFNFAIPLFNPANGTLTGVSLTLPSDVVKWKTSHVTTLGSSGVQQVTDSSMGLSFKTFNQTVTLPHITTSAASHGSKVTTQTFTWTGGLPALSLFLGTGTASLQFVETIAAHLVTSPSSVTSYSIQSQNPNSGVQLADLIYLTYTYSQGVPEPSTYLLLGSMLLAVGFTKKRKQAV